MKKVIAALLGVWILVSLAGCGTQSKPATVTIPPPPNNVKLVTLDHVFPQSTLNYRTGADKTIYTFHTGLLDSFIAGYKTRKNSFINVMDVTAGKDSNTADAWYSLASDGKTLWLYTYTASPSGSYSYKKPDTVSGVAKQTVSGKASYTVTYPANSSGKVKTVTLLTVQNPVDPQSPQEAVDFFFKGAAEHVGALQYEVLDPSQRTGWLKDHPNLYIGTTPGDIVSYTVAKRNYDLAAVYSVPSAAYFPVNATATNASGKTAQYLFNCIFFGGGYQNGKQTGPGPYYIYNYKNLSGTSTASGSGTTTKGHS